METKRREPPSAPKPPPINNQTENAMIKKVVKTEISEMGKNVKTITEVWFFGIKIWSKQADAKGVYFDIGSQPPYKVNV